MKSSITEGDPRSPSHAETRLAVLLVVLADAGRLARVQAVLRRRLGSDYEILGSTGHADGLAHLSELAAAGREVALVLAGRRLADEPGSDFLADAVTLTPGASRGLLVDWAEAWGGDPEARSDPVRASVLGQFDRLVFAPTVDPDEGFFGGISELLDLWARRRHSGFEAVQVVGERWSAETHALRDLLEGSSIPAAFHEPGSSEGQRLLRQAGAGARVPVAVLHDGRILVQPTVSDVTLTTERPVAAAFILIGAIPRTDWLPPQIRRDDHGFVLTGGDAGVSRSSPRSPVETSLAGVFAVGDARAGSTKRIASAVGEGSVAVRYVHDHLARLAEA